MKNEVIGTLLAVDDEQDIRQLAAEFAAMWGFKVFLAADAKEALKIVRTESPDVIVSDLAMPGQDGIAFLKQIRDEGFRTPFLFLSAFMTKEHATNSLDLGAIDFLSKPFTPRELKLLLYEMLAVSKAQKASNDGLNDVFSQDALLQISACHRAESILRRFNDRLSPVGAKSMNQGDGAVGDYRVEMIALFATEAMSLLKSVQEVLTEMQRSDTPGRQIGCLFRMMRSLRLAAGRLGFGQIKDLAQALEHNYIQWRVHSSYMNPMGILTISGAHEILRRNIEAMHSKHGLDYDSKYSLARETNLKVQELRSVIDADS